MNFHCVGMHFKDDYQRGSGLDSIHRKHILFLFSIVYFEQFLCFRSIFKKLIVTSRIRRMWKGTVFTGVCPHQGGGFTLVPGSFPGHWSQIPQSWLWGGGYCSPGQRGIPVWGYPPIQVRMRYPSSRDRTGVTSPPPPRQYRIHLYPRKL